MKINFEDVKQGDTIAVTVHDVRRTYKVAGWYNITWHDCLGLHFDDKFLMLQEKFAVDIELISRKTK